MDWISNLRYFFPKQIVLASSSCSLYQANVPPAVQETANLSLAGIRIRQILT